MLKVICVIVKIKQRVVRGCEMNKMVCMSDDMFLLIFGIPTNGGASNIDVNANVRDSGNRIHCEVV